MTSKIPTPPPVPTFDPLASDKEKLDIVARHLIDQQNFCVRLFKYLEQANPDVRDSHEHANTTSGNPHSVTAADLGLGTIATQDADSVNITGGAIDGTTVGQTTPAAGGFTSFGMGSVVPQAQASHIAAASQSHDMTGSDTVSQANLEAAMDEIGTKLNAIIDNIGERFGFTATS